MQIYREGIETLPINLTSCTLLGAGMVATSRCLDIA